MTTLPSPILELRRQLPFDRVSMGKNEIVLHPADILEQKALTYMVDEEGKALRSTDKAAEGNARWLLIGNDDMGDRLVIDFKDPDFPVYMIPQGSNFWEPDYLAPSFSFFCRFLEEVHKMSRGRETEEKLRNNPLTSEERSRLIEFLKFEDLLADVDYWKIWLKGK